ncbi:potassium channel subfamily T member 2 isoform X11 [Penaeus vannamei]|uniref:potassium channel subfamily T member 2 isoform X11 n=1 Tax=Penaeus vannamei TaxID=6689 RepID=UPI00387F551D
MPREFQHPCHKLSWRLDENYESAEEVDYIEGPAVAQRGGPDGATPWLREREPLCRNAQTPRHHGSAETQPLVDPRRAVLLPGYCQDDIPLWDHPDPPEFVNGASTGHFQPCDDIPCIVESENSLGSDSNLRDDLTTYATTNARGGGGGGGFDTLDAPRGYKALARRSLDSMRPSVTLSKINDFVQRAKSEVFEGEDSTRTRLRHLIRNHGYSDDTQRVRVEYYVNENTFKERLHLFCVKSQQSSLRVRIFTLLVKLLTCVFYIIRVCIDDKPIHASCYGCQNENKDINYYLEYGNKTDEQFQEAPIINWRAVWWVNRPTWLWILQLAGAVISLSEALLLAYLNYKGNIWQTLRSFYFLLELVNTVPFILTLCWPPLRNLFVPVFLNCWLAKHALENMFDYMNSWRMGGYTSAPRVLDHSHHMSYHPVRNDLHRAMQRSQSALSQQLMILSATFMCLVFTSVCGIQHFQRAGHRHLNLFQAVYYVIVTFSTVGYGDFVPDIWPSQLFMVIMICVALIVLPTQFEQLAFTWMERKKLGGTYSAHRAQNERHVVVCSTNLQADTIMDFLNEFYAHPHLQDYFVVLLSPMELDPTMKMILQVPMWAQRVIYIQGSCLKDGDLTRARMSEAEACFILAARHYADKTAADEHTILRSWAVKDFAPNVPQYVQIFRPENKLHVKFAEHVVCEDEFKYALLANNCMSPGISTLVTLLLHTSRGQEGQASQEDWHRLYGKCSGNEIYHIKLGDSRFFGEYEGKSFTYASFHSHRKYGVALVGVRPAELPEFYEDTILLNPGPRHIMKKTDICFYMSITKEENSAFVVGTGASSSSSQEGRAEPEDPATKDPEKGMKLSECEDRPKPRSGRRCVLLKLRRNVSVNELQKKLEEEVDRRRERWEEEQGKHLSGEEALMSSTRKNLVQQEGEASTDLRKSFPRHKLEREDTTKSNSPSLSGGNFLDVPRSDTLGNVSDKRPETRRPSILPVPDMFTGSTLNIAGQERGSDEASGESEDELDDVPWRSPSEMIAIVKGFPPVSPYIGVSPTLCYLLKEKKPLCCLQLAQSSISPVCEHCSYRSAKEYNWQNRAVILAADYASNGIYNFLIPLRAHFRPKTSLNPIILLLERRPDVAFLDAISWFPLIYWMLGSIDCLDDLLRAGINLAENVVVVNKELNNSAEEDTLSDCNTIVAVQTMFKFFPNIKIITELSQSSNMRFMQFRARDAYALHLSKMEKVQLSPHDHIAGPERIKESLSPREKERGSHISYMFRLPFAAGSVFSASMLDTLLYQAFVKDYLITFVRLLLGVDQAPGSGFLTSMKIGKQDLWIRTYGRLYQKLCSTTCEIPIGIYRTIDTSNMEPGNNDGDASDTGHSYSHLYDTTSCFLCQSNQNSMFSLNISDDPKEGHSNLIERAEIAQLVRSRMQSLGLPPEDYDDVSEKRNSLSFVIINPSCDLKLEEGDIVYLIRPSPFSAQKTFERHNSRRKSNISLCDTRRRSTTFSRPPPLTSAPKSNSLSLPDSPQISPGPFLTSPLESLHVPMSPKTGFVRGRSNSLRVDDILMRRSNSLRFGLEATRKINSFEELGISPITPLTRDERTGSIKIPVNGSIGLEVTPPEECGSEASVPSIQLQGTIV